MRRKHTPVFLPNQHCQKQPPESQLNSDRDTKGSTPQEDLDDVKNIAACRPVRNIAVVGERLGATAGVVQNSWCYIVAGVCATQHLVRSERNQICYSPVSVQGADFFADVEGLHAVFQELAARLFQHGVEEGQDPKTERTAESEQRAETACTPLP